MCGFVAILKSTEEPLDTNILDKMTSALRHRGPDEFAYGFVSDDSADVWSEDCPSAIVGKGVAYGHRRLRILDLSPGGRQPMFSDDGRYSLVFNGEVYNYVELREELRASGYVFRTGTDSEVVLHALSHWREGALNRFNGMWSLVFWDRREHRLLASRDRFGIKPLYYTRLGPDWVFASEVKALLPHPSWSSRPNLPALSAYVDSGAWPAPGETFFESVREVEPACFVQIDNDELRCERFWSLPSASETSMSEVDAISGLGVLIDSSVDYRLRSDVRVGTMLSGGIDSTTIIDTVLDNHQKRGVVGHSVGPSLMAFHASFPGQVFDEAKKVDSFCEGLNLVVNKVLPMERDDVRALFESNIFDLEMPFHSSVSIVDSLLMARARERGVTVLLNGHGADELFAGYPHQYCALATADLLGRGRVGAAGRELWAMSSTHGLGLRTALHNTWQALRNDSVAWARELAVDGRESPRKSRLDTLLKWHFFRDILPRWLQMEDRVSMAHSVEARLPFLDHRIVEFAFSLPNRFKIRNGMTKYVLRKTKEGRLPPSILFDSKKTRFSGPDVLWLRGPLRSLVTDSLAPGKAAIGEFVSPDQLQSMVERSLHGGNGAVRKTYRALTTEIFMRRFFHA